MGRVGRNKERPKGTGVEREGMSLVKVRLVQPGKKGKEIMV